MIIIKSATDNNKIPPLGIYLQLCFWNTYYKNIDTPIPRCSGGGVLPELFSLSYLTSVFPAPCILVFNKNAKTEVPYNIYMEPKCCIQTRVLNIVYVLELCCIVVQ